MDRYGSALALGVESMDNEHRQLAALFDAFAASIRENTSLERTREIVREALALANEHFAHEEEMMDQTGYPTAEEEKLHHRTLRLQITTLISDTLSMPGNSPATLENLAKIEQLLFEHINGPDRQLAEYLVAHGVH